VKLKHVSIRNHQTKSALFLITKKKGKANWQQKAGTGF
jgi:hypothetical protein